MTGIAARIRRWLNRLWTPMPTQSPKVIEKAGVVRPAPGVIVNGAGFFDARELSRPWWIQQQGQC